MESQPQNSEFRNNPENFHPWLSCFTSQSIAMVMGDIEPHLFIGKLEQAVNQ